MPQDSDAHHRRSIRLRGYDYTSPGAYFVTITTWERGCLFGAVVPTGMVLNDLGDIVASEWRRTAEIRPEIRLDEFVVMPNLMHALIVIRDVGAHGRAPLRTGNQPVVPTRQPRSVGSLIAGFKSAATRRVNEARNTPGVPVWQRNYYERIIRDDEELDRVRQYILDNPAKWNEDPENSATAK